MKTKQMKQQEAQERNNAWAKLTDAQKIEQLQQRPGKCTKQIAKLTNKE